MNAVRDHHVDRWMNRMLTALGAQPDCAPYCLKLNFETESAEEIASHSEFLSQSDFRTTSKSNRAWLKSGLA